MLACRARYPNFFSFSFNEHITLPFLFSLASALLIRFHFDKVHSVGELLCIAIRFQLNLIDKKNPPAPSTSHSSSSQTVENCSILMNFLSPVFESEKRFFIVFISLLLSSAFYRGKKNIKEFLSCFSEPKSSSQLSFLLRI